MEAVSLKSLYTPGSEGLLSPLKHFFQDKSVSEILINKPFEVFVERAGVMECHELAQLDAMHLRRLFTFIANENGQNLCEESPFLSGNLYDDSRVQLVIAPAARYPALSIRRPSIQKRTLEDYKASNFYDNTDAFDLNTPDSDLSNPDEKALLELYHRKAWGDFIHLAVQMKKNIVVSGQTSSGKTTYLNACTASMPRHERIITLEDTYELDIPHQNKVSLCAPKRTDDKPGALCMQDLVQCAMRLRPDRLIMGEIRGPEILDFVAACFTGHEGSITSIHAKNPRVAFLRMIQLYKLNNVPSMRDQDIFRELNEVIDIIIQVTRTTSGRESTYVYYKNAQTTPFLFNS